MAPDGRRAGQHAAGHGLLLNPYGGAVPDVERADDPWVLRSAAARALLAGGAGVGIAVGAVVLGGAAAHAEESDRGNAQQAERRGGPTGAGQDADESDGDGPGAEGSRDRDQDGEDAGGEDSDGGDPDRRDPDRGRSGDDGAETRTRGGGDAGRGEARGGRAEADTRQQPGDQRGGRSGGTASRDEGRTGRGARDGSAPEGTGARATARGGSSTATADGAGTGTPTATGSDGSATATTATTTAATTTAATTSDEGATTASGGRQAAATAAPSGESVQWQTVSGDAVRNFAYDATTGTTTRTVDRAHNGSQRTDVFAPDGSTTTTVTREDGTRREVVVRPNGTQVETEYDAEGERLSRRRSQGTPLVAPTAPAPRADTEAAQFTITDATANLVNVATDPTSGSTTATKATLNGGQRTERYNADGSMTWTTELPGDRVEQGSVDARGATVKRVYRDGELVRESESVTAPRTAPTTTPEERARFDSTVYVTANGERATQHVLADASVTDQRLTETGEQVRRTVAENGAGLTVRDQGPTTVYRQVAPDGRTTVRRVDEETGKVTTRRFRGTAPAPITLPQYVLDDPTPEVTGSTTAAGRPVTTTTWDNGTTLTEYALLNGDRVVETSLPGGPVTQQVRHVDGDVATLQEQPDGTRVLSTRDTGGAGVQQELPAGLVLPLAAVEVVDTDQPFTDVTIENRGGRQTASFDWGDWAVDLTTNPDGTTTLRQEADEDARDSLNDDAREAAAEEAAKARRAAEEAGEEYEEPEVDLVDWTNWTIRRTVDRFGELVERSETRVGEDDNGEHRAEGRFAVTPDGGTTSSWTATDPDGTQRSHVEIGADGSIRQVNALDPEFGADYRTAYTSDAAGNVVSTMRWDETDFGNGVSDFRIDRRADGEGYVRYGRQGTGEQGMRYVFTDVTDAFDDGRPVLTPEEAEYARENGRVITRGFSAGPGESWRTGRDALMIVPDWAVMELGDEMAQPPSRGVAGSEYAPDGGPIELPRMPGPSTQAPVTVARYLGNKIAEGFGADGLAAGTIANAAAGLAGVLSGDPNALRNTAIAIAGDGVTELAGEVFTGDLAGAAGSAGYLATHLLSGGTLENASWGRGVAAPIVTGLATDSLGAFAPGVGSIVGLGIDALSGKPIQVEDELIKIGATVGCSAIGTPLLGAACGAVAGFLTSLFGGSSKPDDLAEEFSHAYDDHEDTTRNPFAGLLDDARSGNGAHEELWTFEDGTNLGGAMEFAPDRAGELTRQAYLASAAPHTTENPEAQRREDFANLARSLAPRNPELRPVAAYLLASARFTDASRGKGEGWFRDQFAQAAQTLGLTEQFDVVGASSRMSTAEAQVAIDEAGRRLGYDVFNPFANRDLDPRSLRSFDQRRADLDAATEATSTDGDDDGHRPGIIGIPDPPEPGEAPADYYGAADRRYDDDRGWVSAGPQPDAELYAGDWWRTFYEAQDRLAAREVADVVPNTFGDHDEDDIDDMDDEDVYRTFLRPTYIGPDDDGSYVRQVHQAREGAAADTIVQIQDYARHSDLPINPALAALLLQDGAAGTSHPASFAPRRAPLLQQDDGPGFDVADGVAQVILTGADAVASFGARPA